MSSLQRDLLISGLPPRQRRKANLGNGCHPKPENCSPVPWTLYFNEKRNVAVNGNTFTVYTAGHAGPLLVLLHGGGYNSLTWALFTKEILSIAECQVLAIDLRGHGGTQTQDDSDLAASTQARDVADVVNCLYSDGLPRIVLLGHSMGGAIAVHICHGKLIDSVVALIVIDIVEGTALEALASMQSLLRSQPKSFKSVVDAITWSMNTGKVRNIESARVSVPGQLTNVESGLLAADESMVVSNEESNISHDDAHDGMKPLSIPDTIGEDDENICHATQPGKNNKYTWRIDLSKTEAHWNSWFRDLSTTFLDCKVQKLLLLADVDRLDRQLTIGQMQGKFGIQILSKVGHAVHEDEPEEVAKYAAQFIIRNKFCFAKQ